MFIQYRQQLILLLLTIFYFQGYGQEQGSSTWNRIKEDYKIKTSFGFQVWSTYTIGQELYANDSRQYIPVDDRFNTELRRSRLSISGQPYPNLKFKLTASLDLLGRDKYTATQGGTNNQNFGQFGVWNMYLRYQPFLSKDLLHITLGFQPPQIGRASITAALRSTSFEKSWSQNYLRRHLVGRGPGRAMGINVGGQHQFNSIVAFSYDTGIFTPQRSSPENTQGIEASPLLVGRVVFHIGDPESPSYSTGHKINHFGQRNGISLALAGSHQGPSADFTSNDSWGFDMLLNWGMLNLDGEWSYLHRSDNSISTSASTGYVRLGYNFPVSQHSYIEPVVMYVKFNGPLSADAQAAALALNSFAGSNEILDIGVNYYLNPNFKLSITYTHNKGSLGAAADGATFNNHYTSAKEAIRRGDLLGLAVVVLI